MRVALIAGGTGAAKLAVGLQEVLAPGDLTVITNTADDCEFWGLHISPDTDSVLFRLAGIFNEETGFGVAGDTFTLHSMMSRLGEPAWFWLGDRDLAFHILRTRLLRSGHRLTETALELSERLGLRTRVVPVSDDPIRTFFETDGGRFGFQEYFVREGCRHTVTSIDFSGLAEARPSPEAAAAVQAADLVIIGPSNPLISTMPVLGVLQQLVAPERTLAVSPIIAGRALKGPTVEMMTSTGREPSPIGVGREYRGLAAGYVLDTLDAQLAPDLEALGYRVLTTDTVMQDGAASARLARGIVDWKEQWITT